MTTQHVRILLPRDNRFSVSYPDIKRLAPGLETSFAITYEPRSDEHSNSTGHAEVDDAVEVVCDNLSFWVNLTARTPRLSVAIQPDGVHFGRMTQR